MTKLVRAFALLLIALFALASIVSCGSDDEPEEAAVLVNFVSAIPPDGELAANGTIKVTFDHAPTDVTVSPGTIVVSGKKATITGPFTPGALALKITWTDGIQVLNYTVTGPCCYVPLALGGSVTDGDTDVNPEAINSDGKIEIEFSEEVTGNITLQTENGEDVGWIGKVEGNKGVLELVKGRELVTETTYVIAAKLSDARGNRVDIKITFVTRGKP